VTAYTLFSQATPTGGFTTSENEVTIGITFALSQSCTLNAIWWYSPSGATSLPTIGLYEVSGQVLVATLSPAWSGAAGSGWVRGPFVTPPVLTAVTIYKACVYLLAADSLYETDDYWSTGPGASGLSNGPLLAPSASSSSDGQEDYNFAVGISYPGTTYTSANWWIDPEVTPVSTGGNTHIVQQVTGSSAGGYGVGTTAITSTEGNGLVAFIGWNCVTSGSYIGVPSACVSDSTGNLWKQIGISRGGPGITSTTRCAIWATVNAQSVDWVSVGIAGYTASAAWTITEIAGLAQVIDIDYSISANSGGTAPTLTGVASSNDIGFALFASGNSSQALAGPAGWTALTSEVSSTGSASTGMSVYPYWNTGIIAGSVTTNGTFGTVSSYSVVQCALIASVSPPPQYDFRFPLIITEAAFGATPGNASSSLDFTFASEYVPWADISTRVIGDAVAGRISAARGRQYELQQEEAGQMTIYLDNHDGAFTPTNPGSPYYSNALNSNMSFQSGISGWRGVFGASLSQSRAETFASGLNANAQYSMLITPDGVTANTAIFTTVGAPVNQNYTYSFSCWVMCPAGWTTGAAIVITWANSGGDIFSTSGSVSPIPAGVWTQITYTGVTPASGSTLIFFGLEMGGTPPSSTLFYVAEAAVVTGTAVTTGLVALETPMRISCWWQGRQYPLWSGFAERWPQSWPDMPQWGFSQVTATDAIAVAAAGSMYSALIGEVLIDNPYAYLPCNEQYTTATTGATPANLFFYAGSPALTPVDANGQIALNSATNNQAVGVYFDGQTVQVSTGLSINFLGDDGTGMGATGYSSQVTGTRGPSLLYSDPGLPAVAGVSSSLSFTLEFWFSWDGTATQGTTLLSGYSTPSAFIVQNETQNNGACLVVNIVNGGSEALLNVQVGDVSLLAGAVLPSQSPQHCVVQFTGGGSPFFTVWLNGVNDGSSTTIFDFALDAIVLGPGRYSYDCQIQDLVANFYSSFNYAAGHLAVYSYILPASRIAAHYQTGEFGWSGVSAGQRFAQILDWAQLGLRRGGYLKSGATGVAEITQVGPAYQLNGSTASDAINAVAQGEGGQYYVKADGTITYLERTAAYNLTAQAVLGDNATSAPDIANPNPEININNGVGWSATGAGSVTYESGMTYGPLGTLLFQPGTAVSTLAVSPFGPVTAGGTYTTGAWVFSAAGGTVAAGGIVWNAGSTVGTTTVIPPSSWTYIQSACTVPAGVTRAGAAVYSGTSPLYIATGALIQVSPEVPYEKETEFDFDNSYLYNEVTATLESGPNQLTVYDDRNLASEQQYFRRSALSFSSNVVSPYDVSDVTTWSIAEFAQPSIHVAAIKIEASANPVIAFPVILNLDIGDIVQVNRRPVGGAMISELGIIERISYDIGSRYFYVTYQVSPYQPSNNVLCADTTGYDTPGTTILAW